MDQEQNEQRVGAISSAFRGRIAARQARLKEAGVVTEAEVETPEGDGVDGGEAEVKMPDESWKKDEILDWLVGNEVITEEQRDDVKGQTKAELIENFVG